MEKFQINQIKDERVRLIGCFYDIYINIDEKLSRLLDSIDKDINNISDSESRTIICLLDVIDYNISDSKMKIDECIKSLEKNDKRLDEMAKKIKELKELKKMEG